MSIIKKENWNDENLAYLKANTSKGIIHLAEYFDIPQRSVKKKLTTLGIPLFYIKTEKEKEMKPLKIDNTEGFDNSKHKIKNNSTDGKVKLWIQSERMFVYHEPGKDQQQIIDKFANRHKPIV